MTMGIGYSIFEGTMADLAYPEVEAAAAAGACVLLPSGVIEQHGPHLPLGTDAYAAYQLCRLLAGELHRRDRAVLIAPPLFWGVNEVSRSFAGTFRVRPDTARALHDDVLDSLATDGFTHIFVVSHHGDLAHNRMLLEVVQGQHAEGREGIVWLERRAFVERLDVPLEAPYLATYDLAPLLAGFELTGELGVHAEETEGALMARYFPELVDFDAMQELEPTGLGPADLRRWRQGGPVARSVTPRGYFGAPAPRDPFLWRLYERMASAMADLVSERLAARERPC
jgi:creatinine amidohydrolase